MNSLKIILNMSFDAPSPWGIYFQDSASPQFEGLIELHEWNTIVILLIIFIDTVNDLLSFLSAPLNEVSLFLYVYMSCRFFFLPPQ